MSPHIATHTMKPSHLIGTLLGMALACGSAHAIDCKQAITTPDINHCAKQEQLAVEARLNAAYQKTLKSLNEPDTEIEKYSEMKQKLIQAQRAWVKFRDLDCDAVYAFHAGGTIRTVMFLGCMQRHAEQRIKALDQTYGPR